MVEARFDTGGEAGTKDTDRGFNIEGLDTAGEATRVLVVEGNPNLGLLAWL